MNRFSGFGPVPSPFCRLRTASRCCACPNLAARNCLPWSWCYSHIKHQLAVTPRVELPERTMDSEWNDSQPIYRQLRDRVVAMILDAQLADGDALPSVRNVATEGRINPLTVLKAYQQLTDEGLVEKRRGLGMFVMPGARQRLLQDERERFLKEQWPEIGATIHRLV